MSGKAGLRIHDIHPVSAKYIKNGHPWVTLDQYSKKFDQKSPFIIASHNGRAVALLLNDPQHKTVRARVWSTSGKFESQIESFPSELSKRLNFSINKRLKQDWSRDHFYLVFGEADQLPGLHIIKLGPKVLIQYYSQLWKKYQPNILKCLKRELSVEDKDIWIQYRASKKMPARCLESKIKVDDLTINEGEFKFKIKLGEYYDHGVYTDMAQIRTKLAPKIRESKSFLNLFCYTGAYSLQALSLDVPKVHSVDLSDSYLAWLDENIHLNEFKGEHFSYNESVENQLKEFSSNGESFDFIICDPPTSSSDGNKRTNALKSYQKLLPLIDQVLEKNGQAVVFLNTHQTTYSKFQKNLAEIIKNNKLKLKQIKSLKMEGDCPVLKSFPEGNYLKGIIFEKL